MRTLDTLAIGKIVFDVGFLLLVSELFMTPNSLCQITLSIYTMLTVTAFYKYIEQLIITITKFVISAYIIPKGQLPQTGSNQKLCKCYKRIQRLVNVE